MHVILNKFIDTWCTKGFVCDNLNNFLVEEDIDSCEFYKYYIDEMSVLYELHNNIFNKILNISNYVSELDTTYLNKIKLNIHELNILSTTCAKELLVISKSSNIINQKMNEEDFNKLKVLNSSIEEKQISLILGLQHEGYAKNLNPSILWKLFKSVLMGTACNNYEKKKYGISFKDLINILNE